MELKIFKNKKIIKIKNINIGFIYCKKKYYMINFILLIKIINLKNLYNKSLYNFIIFLIKYTT